MKLSRALLWLFDHAGQGRNEGGRYAKRGLESQMTSVYGRLTGETVNWFNRNPAQSNQHCLYCGVAVGEGSTVLSNKEHLIGRNFVPTGALGSGGFNFIFRSCRECNSRKANAERHISSVTLVNSPGRANDQRVDAVARRKATQDFHPDKKGIPVGCAIDNHSVEFTHGPLSIKFGLTSPPQPNPQAVLLLAFNHIQALFSLVTTEDCRVPKKMRLLPDVQFCYFGHYGFQDWGNPHLIEIAKRTEGWSCPANVTAADGYFRAILKRDDARGWFWALEWNRYLRVVGAIVQENEPADVFEALPKLDWRPLPDGRRFRADIPLVEEADHLFCR